MNTFWMDLWTIVLIGGLLIFAGLVIVVGVGGIFDIRKLLKDIDRQHRSNHARTDSSSSGKE